MALMMALSLERMQTIEHPISERVRRDIPVQSLPMQRDSWFHRNRMRTLLLDVGG